MKCRCGLKLVGRAEKNAGRCRFCWDSTAQSIREGMNEILDFALVFAPAPAADHPDEGDRDVTPFDPRP